MIVWDNKKNLINIRKHGISFQEAKKILEDALVQTSFNSIVDGQERWEAFGYVNNRLILVIYSSEHENAEIIRIISAREVTKKEKEINMNKSCSKQILGHAASTGEKAWFGPLGYREQLRKKKKADKWK